MKDRNGSIALEEHSKRNDQRINYTGVVDCVEEERELHIYLEIQGKTDRINVHSFFFRFIISHAFKKKHYILKKSRQRQYRQEGKGKEN